MPDTNSVTNRLNQYRLNPPTLTPADLKGLSVFSAAPAQAQTNPFWSRNDRSHRHRLVWPFRGHALFCNAEVN
jgi:hypothetical protein